MWFLSMKDDKKIVYVNFINLWKKALKKLSERLLIIRQKRNNTLRIVIMTDELHSLHSTKEEFHVRNQLDL